MSIAEKLQTIAENEQRVYDVGYNKGKAEGVEAGKKAEYDRFWDSYQDKGGKTDYSYGFAGYGWNDETFKPKYDIKAYSGANILSGNMITDFVGLLNKYNVIFDTSKNTVTSYVMQGNNYTINLPILDMRSRKKIDYFISSNSALKSIEKIILKEDGSQTFNGWSFNGNTALEDIRFEGLIGKSVSFAESSKLTHDSLINNEEYYDSQGNIQVGTGIINRLAIVSTAQTLTLHADAKARLTTEEIAIATQKGWTVA